MVEQALIIAFMVYFLKASLWKGMIFCKVHDFLKAKLPEKLYKPTVGCPVCMTIWWGALFYNAGYYLNVPLFNSHGFFHVVYVLFTAGGINTVILMLNKEYDVAIKEDKLLKKEMKTKHIK